MKIAEKRPLSHKIVVSVYRGQERLFTQAFDRGPIIFGRQPNCDVVLDFTFVSRTHCQILEQNGQYYIEDLKSRNGIYVAGKQVERGLLESSLTFDLDELKIEVKVMGQEKQVASDDVETIIDEIPKTKTLPKKPSGSRIKPLSAQPQKSAVGLHPAGPSARPSGPPAKVGPAVASHGVHAASAAGLHKHGKSHGTGGILGELRYGDLIDLHPAASQTGAKRVEAVVMWHDQVYDVKEFEPQEIITIGNSGLANIKIPTLPRGWKLAHVNFDSSTCYIPKGPLFSIRKADGRVVGAQELVESKEAKPKGSGFQFKFSTRDVLKVDLGTDVSLYLRYIPAPPVLTTRKPVEPDYAIKQAIVGSTVLHLVLATLLFLNAPPPKDVPKLKNVPERFARLLVEPMPVQPTPTPPPIPTPPPAEPEPPKKEIVKKEPPPKLPKLEKPKEKIVKKMELPKQLAKENKWPIVVKNPVKNTPAAKVNNPRPAVAAAPREAAPEAPPVKVESMGALAALGGLSDGPSLPTPPTNIKIEKSGAPGAIGPASATASFGEGVPVANGRMAAGGGGGGGAIRTKGNASGSGTGYGTQGLKGGAGTRGIAGAVVGQPKLAGKSGKTEGLTRDQVMKVMQKHLAEVQHCYEKSLLSNPDLAGRMEFEWDIEPSGSVSASRVKKSSVNGGDELGECIKGVFMAIQFPKATNGQSTTPTIGFPFGRM